MAIFGGLTIHKSKKYYNNFNILYFLFILLLIMFNPPGSTSLPMARIPPERVNTYRRIGIRKILVHAHVSIDPNSVFEA